MINHEVRTYKSSENLAREDQLAWKIAEVASDPTPVDSEVTEMVINRVIDNAAVAVASLTRAPIVSARAQALSHPVPAVGTGSSVVGLETRTSPDQWQRAAEQAVGGTAAAVVIPDRPDRAVQVRVRTDQGERTVFD